MNYSRALGSARGFATSSARHANRAVVYTASGDPKSVLSVVTYPDLPSPPPHSVNVRYVLSPVNPSDINVIEGVYPAKPTLTDALVPGHRLEKPVYVGGNEGLAEVTEVGSGVEDVQKGDWVVMAGQQLGTWSSARTLKAEDVIKVPSGVSEVNGATMTVRCLKMREAWVGEHFPQVNPPTAYNMLQDFVTLEEGDWVLQNGMNFWLSNFPIADVCV